MPALQFMGLSSLVYAVVSGSAVFDASSSGLELDASTFNLSNYEFANIDTAKLVLYDFASENYTERSSLNNTLLVGTELVAGQDDSLSIVISAMSGKLGDMSGGYNISLNDAIAFSLRLTDTNSNTVESDKSVVQYFIPKLDTDLPGITLSSETTTAWDYDAYDQTTVTGNSNIIFEVDTDAMTSYGGAPFNTNYFKSGSIEITEFQEPSYATSATGTFSLTYGLPELISAPAIGENVYTTSIKLNSVVLTVGLQYGVRINLTDHNNNTFTSNYSSIGVIPDM